nr:GNAT family N-acetyltransferase [Ramlibacter algicola]
MRPLVAADHAAVLRLNAESVQFLSAMDSQRLAQLHAQAALATVVERAGEVVAFLLAFREGAAYDSVNYQWFAQRYDRFLYVDRVVVGEQARRSGIATQLYGQVVAQAAAGGVPLVALEIDSDPPNAPSERFHARYAFREVGRQAVPYAPKVVSMRVADVPLRQATAG